MNHFRATKILTALVIALFTLSAGSAMARSVKAISKTRAVKLGKEGKPVITRGVKPAEVDACAASKQKITAAETAVKEHRAGIGAFKEKLVAADNKIRDLIKQLKVAKAERRAIAKDKKAYKRQGFAKKKAVKRAKLASKKACAARAKCAKYEKRVDTLQAKMKPHREKMDALRKAIKAKKVENKKLQKEVDAIEAAYVKTGCPSMHAGSEDQKKIDKCADLFSQWNARQKQINALNGDVKGLRKEYRKQSKAMKKYYAQMDKYNKFMKKNCTDSDRMEVVRKSRKKRKEDKAIEVDLRDLESKMKKLKKIRIKFKAPKIKIKLKL